MKTALSIGLALAASILGAPALAGSAPAAYYPSLWVYGGAPGWAAPQAYAGEPAYYDEPQGYAGDPAYYDAPPQGYGGEPYGPPDGYTGDPAYGGGEYGYGAYSSGAYGSSSSSSRSYSGGSVQRYEYDSGWRDPRNGDLLPGERPHEDGYSHSYDSGWREHGQLGAGAYSGSRVQEYEYDSGWRGGGGYYDGPNGHVPPPVAYPGCVRPAPVGPPPIRHYACPMSYQDQHLPSSFFADAGGVGPAYINGGGGGGGFVIAGAGARASASARASARVSIKGGGKKHGKKGGCGHC